MALLETKEEKKSFTITVVIHVVILLLLFMFGLKYLDPPLEQGIAVNFGTTDYGSGDVQPTEPIKSEPRDVVPQIEETKSEPTTSSKSSENVLTADNTEAIAIQKQKEIADVQAKAEANAKVAEQKKKQEEADKKANLDALIGGVKKSDGKTTGGEGNDNKSGDKGSPEGDPNASSYYGIGKGLDGDDNYLLVGRRAINKKIFVQDCNQEGIVVVDITVDRNGNVTSAVPGVRGTTNNSKCLTDPARRAALETKFNSDPKAPAGQRGQIIYRFSLSE